jgi:hypothetical protein
MQREADDELYPILLLIFSSSASLHGWIGPAMNLAAYGWATERAASFANYWVDSIRERTEAGLDKLRTQTPNEETTIEEAREANRETSQPEHEVSREELDDMLEKIFGPKRIEGVAIDETTRARHAGGEAGVEATVGLSDEDIWRCDWRHDNVCEICSPLDGMPRSVWELRFPDGPPDPHPRCRCWIDHARKLEAVTKSLKAFDPSEPRDEHGRWSGGGAEHFNGEESATMLDKIRAGDKQSKNGGDLRKVNDAVPHSKIQFPISLLSHDDIEHLRSSTDAERVAKYSTQHIDTPIHITRSRRGRWVLNDGGHRLMAAIQRGDTHITALVPTSSIEHLSSS